MNIPFYSIDHQLQEDREELDAAYKRVLERQWFAAGEEVDGFEREFAAYCHASFFVACANGTDALELIFRGCNIGPGDEVIVPSFTCWATIEPLLLLGVKPVFVDIVPESYTMNPDLIQSAITNKTRAILVVHLFGYPAAIKTINSIAKQNGLDLIEDCAQAHGVKVGNKMLGTFGKAAAFSFYPTKALGALGEAGGILTNDSNLATKLKMLVNHGQVIRDKHEFIGKNSRMDELQAAFLRIRLKQLDRRVAMKRALARQYNYLLYDIIQMPEFQKSAGYHQCVIHSSKRNKLQEFLSSKGVGTGVHYPYSCPDYSSSLKHFPVAEHASKTILSIPSWPGMSSEQIEYVSGCLMSFKS